MSTDKQLYSTNLHSHHGNVVVHGYPSLDIHVDMDVQDLDMHVVGTMMLHVGRE